MSPHLHNGIARARQEEIASRANNAHSHHATRPSVTRRRSAKRRLVQVVAAFGVCVGAGTAIAVSDAHSNQGSVKEQIVHVSAQQLAREIRTLEAKGYVPSACTVNGTLLRNYRTGQSVTVDWQQRPPRLGR